MTVMQSKRILVGSPFDANRAEPSQQQQQQGTTPPLDMQRAELSRQHVRALNAQFASWVQTQLQNHPDELWEDGVQDYMNHASNIMVKFSDVVNWLKANAAKGESLSVMGSNAAQKTLVSENKEEDSKSASDKPGIAPADSTISFGNSWSSGAQKNLLFGSKENDSKSSSDKPAIAPAGTTVSFGSSWSSGAQKNLLFGSKENDSKSSSDKPGIAPAGATVSFGSSWSSGAHKNLLFGSKENGSNSSSDTPGIAPAGTTVSFGTSWSSGAPKNLLSESKGSGSKLSTDKPGIALAATKASFGSSWSSGVSLNNTSPFSFGIQTSGPTSQNSVPLNHNASNEEDGEADVEQPSSPSVKKTEEKGIRVVHEVKCKLYVKSSDPADKDSWKDKGMGQLSIKCKEGFSNGAKEAKPTVVVRNDVGRVLLNALLYPGIKTNMQKNAIVAIFHTSGDGDNSESVVARTFLIRTKTEEDRNKLAAVIQEHAPAA